MIITTQTRSTDTSNTDKRYPIAKVTTEATEMPLERALQNVGYKLIDNIRYIPGNLDDYIAGNTDKLVRGKHEKRGTVWMPLHKCASQQEIFFGEEVIWRNGIKFTKNTGHIVKIVGTF